MTQSLMSSASKVASRQRSRAARRKGAGPGPTSSQARHREGRVLEHVPAVAALVQVERARLVLQQVGDVEPTDEGVGTAPVAGGTAGVEKAVGGGGGGGPGAAPRPPPG